MGFGNERNAVSDAIDDALDGHPSDDLLGDCPYNARRLYDELQERGVQCHILRGACEQMGEPTPETITEAEDLGIVHWWVEARVDGTWMTIDLASEWTPHLGQTLYQSNRPEPYIPFVINPEHSEDFAKR